MKKPVFFLTAIFLVFSLIILLPAVKADFTLEDKLTTNVVCSGSTILLQHIVTADQSGPFTIAVSGTANSFSTTVPSGFWLDKGQSKTLYTYITPSSKIKPGVYNFKITVENEGVIKEKEHNIIVENCHNVDLKIEPEYQKICACEEKTLTLTITNKGAYSENYNLKVEGPASKWTNLSSKTINLGVDSSVTVDAYIKTPCEVKGDYELNFVIEALPYTKVNKKAKIEIVHCYDYNLDSEKSLYNLCEAEELNIPVKIKNLGTTDNVYKINIDAPEWVKADQDELDIAENEEKTFNLIAKPPYETEGSFTVSVEVLSEVGAVLKKYSIELDAESCYGVDLSIAGEKDKICNALSNSYSVIIKNTGRFTNSFELVIEGPEWAVLSDKYITLNASAETLVDLEVKPPFEAGAGLKNITVKAIDSITGFEASDTISLETISVEDCYKPVISAQKDSIIMGKESAATLPIIVENKGTNTANYSVEISGTAASFCQINPGAITLPANGAQTLYLYMAPPFETELNNYTITITTRLIDTTILASKVISISVVKTEEMPEIPQFSENATNASNFTGTDSVTGDTITGVEEAEEFSLWSRFVKWLADLFKPKARTDGESQEDVITDFNVSNLNDTVENNAPILKKEIPNIEIEQGEEFTIELTDYFEDPDNDSLTYVVIKSLYIEAVSVGAKVTIKPEASFIGLAKITFNAYDGKLVTPSNEVQIRVGMPTETESNNESGNETAGNYTAGNESQGNETAGNYTAGNETGNWAESWNQTQGNETTGNYTEGNETA